MRTYTVFEYLHSNLPRWCRSPDLNPPGNWPRKICFETASDWYRPSMLHSKILLAGVQESTHQHPAPAAINQPGGLVPGQEPAPSYPPVPSPPEFQSLGSPETTEKEIDTVSPMQVRLGNMLGKGRGVGSTAALVVGWAGVVPLGIKHDLRWVGGLCALNGTSVGGRLAPSRSGSRARVDS